MATKIFSLPGWESGPTRVVGGTPVTPPPPNTGLRTMIGLFQNTDLGTAPSPDSVFSNSTGGSYVGNVAGKFIFDYRAVGACFIAQVTGGSQAQVTDDNGDFSSDLWNSRFDIFVAAVRAVGGGEAEMRAAVADGTMRAILVIDDFISGGGTNFTHATPYEQIEDACNYAKSVWPWMPLVARGVNTYLRSAATLNGVVRQYTGLDSGWAQFRANLDGDPLSYITTQIAAGEACGLGTIGGANIRDRGHIIAGCQSFVTGKCVMTPAEIRGIGIPMMQNPKICSWMPWEEQVGYTDQAPIIAALQDVYNVTIGRTEGSINIRGDLVPA